MKQSFGGSGTKVLSFINSGYSFGDPGAPSFIDVIEGRTKQGTYDASLPYGINFFIPNPSLPIKECSISREEALSIIKKVRDRLGDNALVMVAGGRELLFSGYEKQMFDSGANSIVIGDYLTVSGVSAESDIGMIKSIGYVVAKSCNE